MSNDGGPAFPIPEVTYEDRDRHTKIRKVEELGMTLRDYFAAKALQALLSVGETQIALSNKNFTPSSLCCSCYQWADFMLEARKS